MTYRVRVKFKGEPWIFIWRHCFTLGDFFGLGLEGRMNPALRAGLRGHRVSGPPGIEGLL